MKNAYPWLAALASLFFACSAHATGLELFLLPKVASVIDMNSGQDVVKSGGARTYSQITFLVRGDRGQGVKRWLAARAPQVLVGYLERFDKTRKTVARYGPLTFRRVAMEPTCEPHGGPGKIACRVRYAVSQQNIVDIEAGDPGRQVVSLTVMPPAQLDGVRTSRSPGYEYRVGHRPPPLSAFSFAGLDE